jgi:hypothetical protein
MDILDLERKLGIDGMSADEQMDLIVALQKSAEEKAEQAREETIGKSAELVIQGLKRIKSDIETRFSELNSTIQTKASSLRDGIDGKDGRDGKEGKAGRDGAKGEKGESGQAGIDGVDGVDGVSVTNAHIDFDGSLIITLSTGVEINVGEVVAPDLAERIKVITNGGGTSQSVLDTLASLQTQITNLIPSQTGNSGKFLTTNGTSTSWASVAGGLSYQGTWNASTNTPTLTSSVGVNGYYYITDVAGSTNLNGITDWQIGDWLLFNGSVWQKIDQSNLVTSVAGRTGAITLSNTDISGLGTMSTQNASSVTITGGTESAVSHSGDTISDYLNYTPSTAPSYQQGRTWYDSTAKALAFYNDVSGVAVHVGHDLQFKVINNTGSTIANGAPVYITGTSSGQTYPNVALAKADVASTSTVIGLADGAITNGSAGYVTSIGNIDNVNTGTFTVGQVLYLSPYSAGQLMNTIPPTGISVQIGMVTFVDSSVGKIYVKQTTPLNVPASIISGAVAIVNGGTGQTTANSAFNALAPSQTSNSGKYLTTDGTNTSWATVSSGGVTSVTGTSPVASSGGATPAISLSAGYGDTLNPYASKTANFVLSAPNGSTGVPTFRAIVAADIPTLNQNTTGTAASTPKLLTTNFTIEESGGKLLFKNGATTIASMSSTGIITSAANIVANGTP